MREIFLELQNYLKERILRVQDFNHIFTMQRWAGPVPLVRFC